MNPTDANPASAVEAVDWQTLEDEDRLREADGCIRLGDDAVLLRGPAAARGHELSESLDTVTRAAPWRHMSTPGGQTMRVATTNCGTLGWTTDRINLTFRKAGDSD